MQLTKTIDNTSDGFTKNLGSEVYNKHNEAFLENKEKMSQSDTGSVLEDVASDSAKLVNHE